MLSSGISPNNYGTANPYANGGMEAAFERTLRANSEKESAVSNAFRGQYEENMKAKKAGKDLADETAIELAKKIVTNDTEDSPLEYQKALSNIAHARLAVIMQSNAIGLQAEADVYNEGTPPEQSEVGGGLQEVQDPMKPKPYPNFNGGGWESKHEVLSTEQDKLDLAEEINFHADSRQGLAVNSADAVTPQKADNAS